MSKENNKIYFTNSPYNNGHKVVDFVWNARLDENFNLTMDLHLESDQYDEEDEYEDVIEEIDDISEETTEKSHWINYDHCVLSSTFWKNQGIKINTEEEVLDFGNLNNKTYVLDPLPVELTAAEESFAFGISMLGKDVVANHEITFLDTDEFGVFDIKWKGKVANTTYGEESFDYDFYVYMKRIKFGGVFIDPALNIEDVKQFFEQKLVDYPNFELVETEENSLDNFILKLKMK